MDGKSEAVAVVGSLRFSLLPISWPSLPQEEEAGSVFAKSTQTLESDCSGLRPPSAVVTSGKILNSFRTQSPHRNNGHTNSTAAAAAKSLQSCPTLCDPRVNSPPGSPVPGILQARTLEWVALTSTKLLLSPSETVYV